MRLAEALGCKRVAVLGGAAFIVSCTLLNPLDELENGPPVEVEGPAIDADVPDSSDSLEDAGVESKYRLAVMSDSPVGYWRLGEKTGTVAMDEVGRNDGTYTGGVTLGTGTESADGDTGVTFDGKSGQIVIGNVLGFTGSAKFSVEAWIKVPTLESSLHYVVSKLENDAGSGWYVAENKQFDGVGFGVMNLGLWSEWSAPILANSWIHYVGTYSASKLCVYTNSTLVNCFNPGNLPADTSAALVIGASAAGDGFFKGAIDDVAIYDHELSPDRINAHFAARK